MSTALISLSRLAAPGEPSHDARIVDAREALTHWSRRASDLPWHKRAARREARMNAARARADLIAAHLERWGLGSLARLLTPLLDTRGRSGGAHVRSLALTSARRTAIGRRIMLGVAGIAFATIACLAVVVELVTHVV
jgi:hypothetical protein